MLNKILLVILAAAVLFLAVVNVKHSVSNTNSEPEIYLAGGAGKLKIEIADDDIERSRGLSGRTTLAENEGMLFVFDAPGSYGFWMKNMNFPIDIIWLDEDWRIAGVTANVSPESFPQIFYPERPIKYVLEVKAGFARRQSIQTGQVVELRQK
ncbi:MAG: DUF192 domain-containing protein [Candidatus Vogelbacteria bacterium]|nr:DUF192 domain-containing protein [Candidatus Vogelbacteria bacterium]